MGTFDYRVVLSSSALGMVVKGTGGFLDGPSTPPPGEHPLHLPLLSVPNHRVEHKAEFQNITEVDK